MNHRKSLPHFLCLAFLASSIVAQEPERRAAPKQTERVARARWQPVRPASDADQAGSSVGQAVLPARGRQGVHTGKRGAEATRMNGNRGVRLAQSSGGGGIGKAEMIPTPAPDQDFIVGEYPMEGEIMDGDIIYEDDSAVWHEGPITAGVPCDTLVCDGMSCGGCGGVGCDTGIFCDDNGCDTMHRGYAGSAWRPCLTLCLPQDGWVSIDYLLWWQKGMSLPPMVTQGNGLGVRPILGTSGVRTIYGGNDNFLEGDLDGARLEVGIFLDACHEWALTGDYFGFSQLSEGQTFFGSNSSSLGRPISNASLAGLPNSAQIINYQGPNNFTPPNDLDVRGNVTVGLTSELRSGGFHLRRRLVERSGCGGTIFAGLPAEYASRFDLGIGYRYTQLQEGLMVNELIQEQGTGGRTITLFDDFDTQTQFNGFDFALFYTRKRGLWNLDLEGRFAIGTNHQTVEIDGGRNVAGISSDGGLLAQTTNMGTYDRDRFSVLPEFRATLGYCITPRWQATVGYTFMYWSNVARPGDQIDTIVDQGLLNGTGGSPTHPSFRFADTDFWAQGISFGANYVW